MAAREKYRGKVETNENALSSAREFRVNDRFEINRDDATYNLAIESEIPIDNVLLAKRRSAGHFGRGEEFCRDEFQRL